MEKIEGLITKVSFRNDENGFTVLTVKLNNGQSVAAVGVMPELGPGERVMLHGEWTEHAEYGKQIRVALCEVIRPTTERGIERYLASGLIKGIGPSTAHEIVRRFGEDTLDIIQYNPERLKEISGIGIKRARMIGKSVAEQQQTRDAMVFLQTYGISPLMSMKIVKAYGENAQAVVRDNPYRLVEDIEGIGFRTADRIAASLGIPPDAPGRLRAGVCYMLGEAMGVNGHTYLPQDMLRYETARLLGIDEAHIDVTLEGMLLEKALIARDMDDHIAVYLPRAYRAEMETARFLLELLGALPYQKDPELDGAITRWQQETGLVLNAEQVAAVRMAVCEGVSVITGGPGTGKTTIIRCILALLSAQEDVLLAAPTGRAAKRMSEATGHKAQTLHRLLEYGGEGAAFARNAENPVEADVLIVDEMSMVDIFLMRGLLRALIPGTKLILVGDADQLPSVGAGNVLGDILHSESMPVVRLTEIYRQSSQSMIVYNAHRINQGEMPVINGRDSDFFLERVASAQDAADAIVALTVRRLPGFLSVDPLRDIQVLSPMKKGDCGVIALNRRLQEALNPPRDSLPERSWGETVFRVGDKVMQTRNDYQMAWRKPTDGMDEEGEGVFNGDMGIVTAIDLDDATLTVRFDDDRIATYENAQLEYLELAYCVSVHKSQGSEFPAVIMPAVGGPPMLLTRNLLYTAVTRARRMVVLVGREAALAQMVHNAQIAKRYTGLAQWLRMAT